MIYMLIIASGLVISIAALYIRRIARTPPLHLKLPFWFGLLVVTQGVLPILPVPVDIFNLLSDATLFIFGIMAFRMAVAVEIALVLSFRAGNLEAYR